MVGYLYLNVNSKPAISWELRMATKARGEVKPQGQLRIELSELNL